MSRIDEHLDLLGKTVVDRVTRMQGVVTSVCFDLYGCVQAAVYPPVKDYKQGEAGWFDVKRLIICPNERAMEVPDFGQPEIGGETKPAQRSMPVR